MGTATNLVEALATSIASGLVVGSFVAGVGGAFMGRSRAQAEKTTLTGSYAGGLVALLALVFDIMEKSFV